MDVCVHMDKPIRESTPHQLLQIVTNECREASYFPHLWLNISFSSFRHKHKKEKLKLEIADSIIISDSDLGVSKTLLCLFVTFESKRAFSVSSPVYIMIKSREWMRFRARLEPNQFSFIHCSCSFYRVWALLAIKCRPCNYWEWHCTVAVYVKSCRKGAFWGIGSSDCVG